MFLVCLKSSGAFVHGSLVGETKVIPNKMVQRAANGLKLKRGNVTIMGSQTIATRCQGKSERTMQLQIYFFLFSLKYWVRWLAKRSLIIISLNALPVGAKIKEECKTNIYKRPLDVKM